MGERIILHSDFNNFYASVECLYNPDLKEKAVAVGGRKELRHGIVLSKNELAKSFGVLTAEPLWKAKQKCPNLVVVPPDFPKYQHFSSLGNKIYREYTDRVEPYGIDESWIDLTGCVDNLQQGKKLADLLRKRMKSELGVSLSIGVSYNKVFAKMGSDLKKPDATTCITPDNFKDIVWPLPVRRLFYVGAATEKKLHDINLFTIGDIAAADPLLLRHLLGKWGDTIYSYSLGQDTEKVATWGEAMIAKGIGNSTTTPRDIETMDDAKQVFYMLSESVAERMRKNDLKGSCVQISIRYTDLSSYERQMQLPTPTNLSTLICQAALELLTQHWDGKPLRSLGVRVTQLKTEEDGVQKTFFDDDYEKHQTLEECIDDMRTRFGHWSICRAISMVDEQLSRSATTDKELDQMPFHRGEI